MRRTGQGWRAAEATLVVAMVALLCVVVRAEDARPVDSPPAVSPPTVKLIALKFRDPQYLHGVLMPLGFVISPDVQTNRLLVIARPDEIKQVEDLVRELDVPIERTKDQPQLELKLYRLRHRQPDDLMHCVVPMMSDRGRISADAGSRTLLVKDEPTVHTDIAMIIREIDLPSGEEAAFKTVQENAAPAPGQYRVDDSIELSQFPARPAAKTQRTVKLRVRVCEINRAAVSGLGDEPSSIGDKPLFRAIRDGGPWQAAYQSGAVESCLGEMAERGMLKIVCEPAITVLSGCTATFVSCVDEFEGPVVIEEDSLAEATTRVTGLAVDLKFVPTVADSGLIRLQLSAPFLPEHVVASDSGTSTADRPAENFAVELKADEVLAASGKISIAKPTEPGRGGLGAVPVFGQLFRSKRSVTQETELIVFATAESVETAAPEKLAQEPNRDEPMSR